MSTSNSHDDQDALTAKKPDTTAGYEQSDVKARGIIGFLLAMGVLALVTGALCFEVGRMLFADMAKQDGPKNKWSSAVDIRSLGNMASSPELRSKTAASLQQFPAPQLQTDDGSQDLVNLHAREDLLLENYSWVDKEQGKVRIPISRAMELVAQSGLPVASHGVEPPLMTGDRKREVTPPLTNGFARTGYELEEAQSATVVKNSSAAKN